MCQGRRVIQKSSILEAIFLRCRAYLDYFPFTARRLKMPAISATSIVSRYEQKSG